MFNIQQEAIFDLYSAQAAAQENTLHQWVTAYLKSDQHAPLTLAPGVKRRPRYWLGPLQLPIRYMERIAGPERDIPRRKHPIAWEREVARIIRTLTHPEALPPLILHYQPPTLYIVEGSERHEALRRLDELAVWVIIGCDRAADRHDLDLLFLG